MDAKTVRLIADSTAPSAGFGESGGCRRFRHAMAMLVLESGFGFTYAALSHDRFDTTQIQTPASILEFSEIL